MAKENIKQIKNINNDQLVRNLCLKRYIIKHVKHVNRKDKGNPKSKLTSVCFQ